MSAKVVLTGSTGNLGTYLLSFMIHHPDVAHIWCLNRSDGARERQLSLLTQRGLHGELPPHVTFLTANLAETQLGLKDEHDHSILANATHIVHCAWPVNFNMSFESFAPSIQGVRNLIELAKQATQDLRIYFISSISAAGNWTAIPGARLRVPEAEIDDWKIARFGYGQSKLVAERLLAEASRGRGLTVAVSRVGQVSGPVDRNEGAWPAQEWLPSLIASSKYLGLVPNALGPLDDVDWIPVDRLASAILELCLDEQKSGTVRYHHLANPHAVPWKELAPAVLDKLPTGVKLVDLPTWVDALGASSRGNLSLNSAAKLMPFFENLKEKTIQSPKARAATLEMKHTCRLSSTLANLEPVSRKWMALWMRQWEHI
jgi:thioester reductase-like protein